MHGKTIKKSKETINHQIQDNGSLGRRGTQRACKDMDAVLFLNVGG